MKKMGLINEKYRVFSSPFLWYL